MLLTHPLSCIDFEVFKTSAELVFEKKVSLSKLKLFEV